LVAKKLSKIRIRRINDLSGNNIVAKLFKERLLTKQRAFLISFFKLILSKAALIISAPCLFFFFKG